MSDIPQAQSVVLRNRRPLAPAFHRHIAKSRLMDQTCRAGDKILIYEIVSTEPPGTVRVAGED